jgi:hypothetical protein
LVISQGKALGAQASHLSAVMTPEQKWFFILRTKEMVMKSNEVLVENHALLPTKMPGDHIYAQIEMHIYTGQ